MADSVVPLAGAAPSTVAFTSHPVIITIRACPRDREDPAPEDPLDAGDDLTRRGKMETSRKGREERRVPATPSRLTEEMPELRTRAQPAPRPQLQQTSPTRSGLASLVRVCSNVLPFTLTSEFWNHVPSALVKIGCNMTRTVSMSLWL